MSGLAGLCRVSGPPDRTPFPRMIRTLDQRGPDAREALSFDHGSLATTVRSPGELGANPAWDPSGRWCVATDGELLNARTLLAEFHAWGESPEQASSAGIVACLFAARGLEAGLERLAGDVALLAWDSHTRTFHAIRDRAGQRPLYWAALPDGTVLTASDPEALLAHPLVDRTPDLDAHRDGVAFGASLPPRTAWRGIHKLGPGERLVASSAPPAVLRWWEESANSAGAGGARYRWARSLRFSTELAIQQRAAVDAPVAVALSGGLYAEALLLGVAARRRGRVLAFTLGVDGPGDEGARAAAIAARCDAEHVCLSILPADVPALLLEIAALGEPLLTPEALGFYVIARAAADRGAEVLLTGVGGAALYGGPPVPLSERAAAVPGVGFLGRAARAGAERLGADSWAHRHLRRRPEIDAGTTCWDAVDALAALAPEGDPTGRALWLDRRLDAERGLGVLDRVTAAHGLRAQSPYADASLARLVGSMPIGHLVQVRRPRGLFVEGLAERLAGSPPAHRPMTLPIEAWLADGSLLAGVPEMVADLLPAEAVRRILGAGYPARQQWALVALAAWRRSALRRNSAGHQPGGRAGLG